MEGGARAGRWPDSTTVCAVAAGAGEQLAVGAEGHRGHAGRGLWCREGWRAAGWPVAGSHNRTVPSPLALASSLPSGLKATADTRAGGAGFGLEGAGGRPVAGSHNRTVPSSLALASSLPSGLNVTPYTQALCRRAAWRVRRRAGR